jgi:glycyl-tRNA synthetase beta chain
VADLLLEIGCEEIPARVLSTVLAELPRLAEEDLRAANVKHGTVSALGAPRRIALVVRDVLERQPDVDETIVGPVASAGDKAKGGFARKVGVPPEQVVVENERFVARRKVVGRPALELLPDLLTRLIGRLPFPKSMRWGEHSARFVRPVRWLLALFGGEVVPLELAGVRSGRQSRGHRFLAPEPFVVDSPSAWREGLAQRSVIVDPAERGKQVVAELARIARETGLTVQRDDALVEEVTNLVELPVGVCGSFDPKFLELPEVVVVSAMRRHQRYFAVRKADGKLSNHFVTIAGTRVRDVDIVVRGNERVLKARLADARFFLEEDRKIPLEKHGEKLSRVVWIQKLGTMSERVARLEKLASALAPQLGLNPAHVSRAARLAKADLPTHMVGEFPELQGFVGADYAERDKEPREVSQAIVEHYQPRMAGETPAASPVGAALAVADRVDTLVGCFSAGLAPTGSNDPFALRRAAFGLLQTILHHRWHLSLRKLAELAAAGYGTAEATQAIPAVLEFVLGRLRGLLGEKLPGDLVEAVLAAGYDDPQDAQMRLQALSDFRSTPGFESLSVAIKRAGNIVKSGLVDLEIDAATLGEAAERALHTRIGEVRGRLDPRLAARDYRAVLDELAELRGPIDAFFESIFVMDQDLTVRNRRLALLTQVHRLFLRVADFRQIGGS